MCVRTYMVKLGMGENRKTLKQKDLSIFSPDLCESHQLQVSESVTEGREGGGGGKREREKEIYTSKLTVGSTDIA